MRNKTKRNIETTSFEKVLDELGYVGTLWFSKYRPMTVPDRWIMEPYYTQPRSIVISVIRNYYEARGFNISRPTISKALRAVELNMPTPQPGEREELF